MTAVELQDWRKRMGFTVPQAAEALGLAESSLKNLLYGQRTITARIVKLANLLERQTHKPL
jgi:plasmid maintenance system antidote protein VapI